VKNNEIQYNLFEIAIESSEIRLKSERESMSVPMVSLSRTKRTKPIKWKGSKGQYVVVSASSEYGIATIKDKDIILWICSQLNTMVDAGNLNPERVIATTSYALLKGIGRTKGRSKKNLSGGDYKNLESALDRLTSTVVKTNINPPKGKRKDTFQWLGGYTYHPDSGKLLLAVPEWLYRSVVTNRSILTISPKYFTLKTNLEKWLYSIARRHGGRQQFGWTFTIDELFKRSGSQSTKSTFTFALKRIVKQNNLPEYDLALIKGQKGHDTVVFSPLNPYPSNKTFPPLPDDVTWKT